MNQQTFDMLCAQYVNSENYSGWWCLALAIAAVLMAIAAFVTAKRAPDESGAEVMSGVSCIICCIVVLISGGAAYSHFIDATQPTAVIYGRYRVVDTKVETMDQFLARVGVAK